MIFGFKLDEIVEEQDFCYPSLSISNDRDPWKLEAYISYISVMSEGYQTGYILQNQYFFIVSELGQVKVLQNPYLKTKYLEYGSCISESPKGLILIEKFLISEGWSSFSDKNLLYFSIFSTLCLWLASRKFFKVRQQN